MGYKGPMRPPDLTGSERRALAVVTAGALALRLFRLAHQSLWVDEILSYRMFVSSPGAPFWKKLLYDVHGPLYSFVMHLWSAVSTSDFWLRTPSAIAGACAVYAFARWLVEIGRRDLAVPAALFMALSPFHLFYSQELRFYALLSLGAILALIAFERFRAGPSLRTGIVLGTSFAVACLSGFSMLFLGAAFVVYLAFSGRLRGAHLGYGAVAAGIVLVVIAPWIYREIWFLRQIRVVEISQLPVGERLRGELTLSLWSYPYVLYAFSAGFSLGPSLRELHLVTSVVPLLGRHWLAFAATALLFGALVVSGIVRAARDRRLGLFLAVILVATAAVTLITAYNVKVFNVRYLMCAFPVYLGLAVYGLPSGRRARILVCAAAAAFMLVSDANYLFKPAYAREDVRDAARTVGRAGSPGDLILAPGVEEVFSHYYEGANRVTFIDPRRLGPAAVDEEVARYYEEHPRIWHLRSRNWDKDPADILPRALSRRGALDSTWAYPGANLYLYKKSPL